MKGIRINIDISWNEKISSTLALILIALLSLVVANFALNSAKKIIKSAPDSKVFNIEKRAGTE